MISESALRGYVLEEVLARLLRENGYSLLVRESQDRAALRDSARGLLVRGRGADHQADALGELQIPTPFSLPVRLFAEAKFRGEAVGITAVRNAVGLLDDINAYYRDDTGDGLPLRRYHYRYVLFSTKGFTADAQRYALAHQISLIDLQGPAFEDLRAVTAGATRRLLDLAERSGVPAFPLWQARAALRHALGTWTAEDRSPDAAHGAPLSDVITIEEMSAGQPLQLPAGSLTPHRREPGRRPRRPAHAGIPSGAVRPGPPAR
jgi:hypothetical protein